MARGALWLLPFLAGRPARADDLRRLSLENSFTADDSNPEVAAPAFTSPIGMSNDASEIVKGMMETFLHKNELQPGEAECLVNGSSEFAGEVTQVVSRTVGLMQTMMHTKRSSGNTDAIAPSSINDEAGGISDMVDSINDGDDFGAEASSSNSESEKEKSNAKKQLDYFYGGGRRLQGKALNPAAMAMSATFVTMQIGTTMRQMVHLAHEVVKKCVHADALAAFQMAGKHMRNIKYLEGRLHANGKEIAVEMANATKAYENHDLRGFGRGVGTAMRKVLLSQSNSSDLPEGPPNSSALANLSEGLIEGFFGEGASLTVTSDDYPMPVKIDLHHCTQENLKFFQQVWSESLWLFATEDMDGTPTNITASQKKAQFGTAMAFSMMQVPGALRQCNLGDDEVEMLMDSLKAMGKGNSFQFTWPDGSINKDEVAEKMADSVQAWSTSDFRKIGQKLGRLLQEFAVRAYPQKYSVDGGLLKKLLPQKGHVHSALITWVVPGLAASLLAGLLALRLVRRRPGSPTSPSDLGWDVEDPASDSGVE
jgi:hypothetical protein